jgi:hypothetical protein
MVNNINFENDGEDIEWVLLLRLPLISVEGGEFLDWLSDY